MPITATEGIVAHQYAFVPSAAGFGTAGGWPRYVSVRLGGQDGEYWSGYFGATFSGWTVTVTDPPPSPPPAPPLPPAAPPSPYAPAPSPPGPHPGCALIEVVRWRAGYFVDSVEFVGNVRSV